MKEFAPSETKFFPVRVASILEAILGIVFSDFSWFSVKIVPYWLLHCNLAL